MIEIEPCEPPAKHAACPHAKILDWLVSAQPGQWMRMPPADAKAAVNIGRAIIYHLHPKGIKATIRRTPGFLYIGRK